MLPLLLLTIANIVPATWSCNILGFKYVSPADMQNVPITTRQSGCVPCSRDGLYGRQSPKTFWGAATTAAPATTATPCCTTGSTRLANATGCGTATVRIVGGDDATENQLPWQCNIYRSDGGWYGCGASIISCDPLIIVSAAHCFLNGNDQPKGKTIKCGDWKLDTADANEETRTITQIINHPSYNQNSNVNDIALIKVSGSFTCAQGKIWPACLPSTNKYTYENWADSIVSGWGTTTSQGSTSNVLKYVKVPPVSDSTCNQPASYNGLIDSSTMICAGLAAGGKDACQGDSGGPLVTKAAGVDSGYSLIGVVSFGDGCAGANKYGVYAEVSNYLDWIAGNYGLQGPQ